MNGTGSPNFSAGTSVVGVLYQNTSGTINHVIAENQAANGLGVGIWLEGGSANPSVTVENSNIHEFDNTGIRVKTNATTSELTANVKGNAVSGGLFGIFLVSGLTASVTDNVVEGISQNGIVAANGCPLNMCEGPNPVINGSVSENTVVGAAFGIVKTGQMACP